MAQSVILLFFLLGTFIFSQLRVKTYYVELPLRFLMRSISSLAPLKTGMFGSRRNTPSGNGQNF